MDPKIWSELPYDLLECIASFADIDTRRALGFKPMKLPKSELKIKPLFWSSYFPGIWRCFDDTGKVLKYVDDKGNSVYTYSKTLS